MTAPRLDWPALHTLLEAGDATAVAAALREQDEAVRRELAAPVAAYWQELHRQHRGRALPQDPIVVHGPAAQIAGLACAATPAEADRWVRDDCIQLMAGVWSVYFARSDDAVLAVLRRRDPPWVAELLDLLMSRLEPGAKKPADKMRTEWSLITRIADQAGFALPADDPLAAGVHVRSRHVLAWLKGQPDPAAFVQQFFHGRGANQLYNEDGRTAVAELVRDGILTVGPLIDGSLRRFLHGGTAPALAPFVSFYQRLAPEPAELAPHARTFLALLPAGPTATAFLALGELRRADDAGVLDAEVVLQAAQATLLRSEKKIVRAQLRWLDTAARRRPGSPGPILRATALAFTQQAADLQEAALAVVVKHAAKAAPADRAALLAEAVAALPADLARRAAESLGGDEDPTPPLASPGAARLPRPVPRPLAPPIGSPAELAEEYAALLRREPTDPITVERVLAAFVAFAHADREALRAAFAPVIFREPTPRRTWEAEFPYAESILLKAMAEAATGPAPVRGEPHHAASAAAASIPPDEPSWGAWGTNGYRNRYHGDPGAVLLHRMAEIAAGLRFAPVPELLSTPTSVTGAIAPEVLLDRLERAAGRAGDPASASGGDSGSGEETVWAYDLEQALLRVPPRVDPALVERARAIESAAGRRAAAWFAAGGPELPEVRRSVHRFATGSPGIDDIRLAADLVPTVPLRDLAAGGDPAGEAAEPLTLIALLGIGRPAPAGATWLRCWPTVLPAHPDLIAGFAAAGDLRGVYSPARTLLSELAANDGQPSVGMGILLAGGLTSSEAADRTGAVDAALVLAARGRLDTAGLGRDLALLSTGRAQVLLHAVPALRAIAEAGGPGEVWDIITAMLPEALPPAAVRVPRGAADLLALAADIADPAAVHGEIPAVTALARGGSTNVRRAARRLCALLSGRPRPPGPAATRPGDLPAR